MDKFSRIHCTIYYEALMREIIKPEIKYENKYFNLMKKKKEEKGKTNTKRYYPDILEEDRIDNKLLKIYVKYFS